MAFKFVTWQTSSASSLVWMLNAASFKQGYFKQSVKVFPLFDVKNDKTETHYYMELIISYSLKQPVIDVFLWLMVRY